ncbi:MAG TPA: efflux RND transporter periplasmic adaptor subunit [Gemmatimonadales bacterium]|nr:efflux RND transporter periplasmic adaptor subunit [Gemmatimonadales bacterium]
MTTPSPDLSRLTINRDVPARGVRRALRTSIVIAAVAVVLVAAALWVLGRGGAPVVRVATAVVVGGGGSASSGVVANGYVVARTQASVSAKLPGRLAYLGVAEGSHVTEGQVIARLDNADYTAAVGQAEATLASEQASLIETEADRDELEREAHRARDVRAQNANLIAQQDVELADSKAAQGVARAQAQQARVRAAEAALAVARANLDNTLIHAPFTGTVLRKDAEVGEVVAPSVGGGLTRGAVVTMADLATLEVEVDVNEAYIARIEAGAPARITLDAYPDTSFRGAVRLVVPTADRQKATVQVKVSILDHDRRILPEMGARVEFLESKRQAAGPAPRPRVSVPAEAVHADGAQTLVWLVRDGRLERRTVDAGPASGGLREVRSGLAGGEVLLLSGVAEPVEGMKVRVKP